MTIAREVPAGGPACQHKDGNGQKLYRCDACGVWSTWTDEWAWWCDGPASSPWYDPEPVWFACSKACAQKLQPAKTTRRRRGAGPSAHALRGKQPPAVSFADYSAAVDAVADEIDALVTEDATGAGILVSLIREAAEQARGDIDEALASLDAADATIDALRAKLRTLQRGELPE